MNDNIRIITSQVKKLRETFKKQFGIEWTNEQGEPDLDYVMWLEANLINEKIKLRRKMYEKI